MYLAKCYILNNFYNNTIYQKLIFYYLVQTEI